MVRGTYIYEKSYNQDHIVLDVFLHLAGTLCGGTARQTNTHAVLNLMAAHCTTAQLHTLNTVLIAQCRVQLSAHYAQLYHAQRYQACARYHARRYRAVLTKNLESFPLLLLLTASPA